MALVALSALPSSTIVASSDISPFVISGTTKKMTAGAFRTALFAFAAADPLNIGALTAVGNSTITGTLGGITALTAASLVTSGALTIGTTALLGGAASSGTQMQMGSSGAYSSLGTAWSSGNASLSYNATQTVGADNWIQSSGAVASTSLQMSDIGFAVYRAALAHASGTQAVFWGSPVLSLSTGILSLGTSVSSGALSGDFVLPNTRGIRAANVAAAATKALISLTVADKVLIDGDALGAQLGSSLTFLTAVSKIVPGATSFSHRNNADSADNLLITDAGDVTVRARLIMATSSAKVLIGATGLDFRDSADTGSRLLINSASPVVQISNGRLNTAAATTSYASLLIPSGTAPTSPVSGEFWYNGTNLMFRDGGTTRTITWV